MEIDHVSPLLKICLQQNPTPEYISFDDLIIMCLI